MNSTAIAVAVEDFARTQSVGGIVPHFRFYYCFVIFSLQFINFIFFLASTAKISKVVKNAKVKTKHTRFWGKVKDVGPRADDTNSAFDVEGEPSQVWSGDRQ